PGAYTGAGSRRHGRFETADGGTLFLDEVGEIDPSTQVKLLRVLEERKFERVGGNQTIEVDIRLIAASNSDLRELVRNNKFREDLFFRLDVVNINLPSLKDRAGDIPLLCNHFLKELSEKNSKPIDSITPETINILSSYSWPGNVRELRNTIEKMVVLARSNKLTARDIPQNIRAETPTTRASLQGTQAPSLDASSIADAERQMIENALLKSGNNRTKAAQELGISRRTLHRKLNKYKCE
ncbi:MAG: sigma-54-dependent Fis family transcriptional regulator, partial [Kiritimatiellae bacterium]|nr:sigma-54-dependent Fis family transcriptional regulator [Kiritimatiellia bacterium]